MNHDQALRSAGIGATDIDHVGIAVRDLEAAVEHYRMVFGAEPVHREAIESDGVQEALFAVGGSFVQLLAPTGPDTPVGRFLERRGEGVHHVGYRVPDLAAALDAPRETRRRARRPAPPAGLARHDGGVRPSEELRRGAGGARPGGGRRVTFSIVARDPDTGEIGVAVQTRWFNVGAAVPWAEPGVGAVATQSFAEISYGPKGLALMREGAAAAEALERLRSEDAGEAKRQVAMLDASGRTAAFTGSACVAEAGSTAGDGVSAQANMMERATVWGAMLEAYEAAAGADLADRLLAALRAAEAEGGDMRGRQSAALLVVPAEGDAWARRFDLRVEDHPDPIGELGRLLVVGRAFEHAGRGLDLAGEMQFPEALEELDRAAELAPGDDQIAFFRATVLPAIGRPLDAREELDRIRADRTPVGAVPVAGRQGRPRPERPRLPAGARAARPGGPTVTQSLKDDAKARIEDARDSLLDLSHRIHADPELGYEEEHAAALAVRGARGRRPRGRTRRRRAADRVRRARRVRPAAPRDLRRVRRAARDRPRLRAQRDRGGGRRRRARRCAPIADDAGHHADRDRHAGRGGRRRQDRDARRAASSTASTRR